MDSVGLAMTDEYTKELEERIEQLESYVHSEWQRRADYVALLEVLIVDMAALEEKMELVVNPLNPTGRSEVTEQIRQRMLDAFKQHVQSMKKKCRDTHASLSAKPEVLH
jgi:ribosome maturation protein Sdo1